MDKIKEILYKENVSRELLDKINEIVSQTGQINILVTSSQMTKTIFNKGIQKLYEDKINFIHTLGCSYLYTDYYDVDYLIELVKDNNNIVVFKELTKSLNGSKLFFNDALKDNNNYALIKREIDTIEIAKNNPDKQIILFSCEFETLTPNLAGLIQESKKQNINNLSVILNNKLLPPALRNLLNKNIKIDGYLAPGDLSILIGTQAWEFIYQDFNIPVVVSGFQEKEMLFALKKLLNLIKNKELTLENCYSSLVCEKGNPIAQQKTYNVFSPKTINWKGYGLIPFSGLAFTPEYEIFDAKNRFKLEIETSKETTCIAPEVLTIKKHSQECHLYQRFCSPKEPKDSCMALENGYCNIYANTDTSMLPKLDEVFRMLD